MIAIQRRVGGWWLVELSNNPPFQVRVKPEFIDAIDAFVDEVGYCKHNTAKKMFVLLLRNKLKK